MTRQKACYPEARGRTEATGERKGGRVADWNATQLHCARSTAAPAARK